MTVEAKTWFRPHTLLDKFFEASVIIKGVEGVIELIVGFSLLTVSANAINHLTYLLTGDELREDPDDTLANFVLHSGQHLASGGTTYLVAYLLIHGFIKLVAVAGLLQNKLWAYPFSLVTLGLFMVYQVYQVSVGHSVAITLLTIYDVFLLWLIWREFQVQKAKLLRQHQE
jgi:uncharacterized membrane protein